MYICILYMDVIISNCTYNIYISDSLSPCVSVLYVCTPRLRSTSPRITRFCSTEWHQVGRMRKSSDSPRAITESSLDKRGRGRNWILEDGEGEYQKFMIFEAYIIHTHTYIYIIHDFHQKVMSKAVLTTGITIPGKALKILATRWTGCNWGSSAPNMIENKHTNAQICVHIYIYVYIMLKTM